VLKQTSPVSLAGPSGPVPSGLSGPVFYAGLLAALLGFGVFFDRTAVESVSVHEAAATLRAVLARERASPEVQLVAQWAVDSRDHADLPFVVVDKARARLFAFDASGHLLASAPVLLGALRGDAPDVPATPAGRFEADTWQSALDDGIVWVHGGVALTLHGLPSATSPGRGLQRLASDRIEDRRISDGSLHVAGDFYREFIAPLRSQGSVAYVLPEVLPAREMFSSPDDGWSRNLAQSPRHHSLARRPS